MSASACPVHRPSATPAPAAGNAPSPRLAPPVAALGRSRPRPELSVVVPTLEEAGNIGVLIERLRRALEGLDWELVVVDDDSRDGTAAVVEAAGRDDARIRCLRRRGERGLAGACLDGMALATGTHLAVMDADLQHDEGCLPEMLRRLRAEGADLVVGTRYAGGTAVPGWHPARRALSRLATRLSHRLLGTTLSDPMSGFFLVRADVVARHRDRLSRQGFKLLLDLVQGAREPLRVAEVPYHFSCRMAGRSKLGWAVGLQFLALLARRAAAAGLPRRAAWFGAVGSAGVVVQIAATAGLQDAARLSFPMAQAAAVGIALAGNYTLHNCTTFADRRLRGAGWCAGLGRFAMVGAVGIASNVLVGSALYAATARPVLAALAGAAAGAAWNFGGSLVGVWPERPALALQALPERLS